MRDSLARCDGRRNLKVATGAGRWLLIGNSRWHWALGRPGDLRCGHGAPEAPLDPLVAWAAVGPVPDQIQGQALDLDPALRLRLEDVPLGQAPPWLGVDRALVGWQAWRQSPGRPVLVADAGTALSLTRVGADGNFAGGRLQAGAQLQWRSLAAATDQLPLVNAEPALNLLDPESSWPRSTEPALRAGVLWGMAAAISAAAIEAAASQARLGQLELQLWLTGGDGAELEPLVRSLLGETLAPNLPLAAGLRLAPNLALEALAALRPGPDRR
ncbi:type III pantothenate kinase [Cyanobium sp. WAJ14-Wanaka]|nr:type III pantothenate kinase [Cyanobium sp. WAJ14-Wanaka]